MPINHQVENTGIFTRETIKGAGPDLGPVLRQWAALHNAFWEHWLDHAEAAIDAALADKDASPTVRRDASIARGHYRVLRDCLATGDARGAAFEGFQLGCVLTRMTVRWAEPHAVRGKKVIDAARAGHRSRYGTPEARARRQARYRAEVLAIRQRHPDLSCWSACELVAERYRISPKTVWRATHRK